MKYHDLYMLSDSECNTISYFTDKDIGEKCLSYFNEHCGGEASLMFLGLGRLDELWSPYCSSFEEFKYTFDKYR